MSTRACLSLALVGGLIGTVAAHSRAAPDQAPSAVVASLSHRDKLYGAARSGESLYVVGYPGLVMRSEDNGHTFARVSVPTHDALFSIAFNSAGRGAAIGRSGLVLVTEDAGQHWTEQRARVADDAPHLFGVSVLPGGAIVAVGEFGAIVRSDDGGEHWTRSSYSTERPQRAGSPRVEGALAHRSAEEENEGAVEEARLLGVQFVDDTYGVVVGEFGLVLVSEDGGRSFVRQDSATDKLLFGVHALSRLHVLAAGSDGTLIETRDGGATWQPRAFGTSVHLFGLWASEQHALVFGADGTVFYREGAGEFTRAVTAAHTWLQAASFDAEGRGVLVGGRGFVLYSVDNGKTQRRVLGE